MNVKKKKKETKSNNTQSKYFYESKWYIEWIGIALLTSKRQRGLIRMHIYSFEIFFLLYFRRNPEINKKDKERWTHK